MSFLESSFVYIFEMITRSNIAYFNRMISIYNLYKHKRHLYATLCISYPNCIYWSVQLIGLTWIKESAFDKFK